MQRPRVVRSQGAEARLPANHPSTGTTSLRSVESPRAPVEALELWAGVHIPELGSVGSKDLDLEALAEGDGAGQRNATLEQQASGQLLERLATRAQRFTPRVSLVPPDGLLLEVKGSLHLFNGIDGLLRTFLGECRSIGVEPAIAFAPTPLAALVAARVSSPAHISAPGRVGASACSATPDGPARDGHAGLFVVTNKAQLVSRLSALPLTPLRWPLEMLERLARMGARTIGQVLRLPRAGFARRFGPEPLAELDRLTGRGADLRHHFQPRERFRRRRELTYELENNATLLSVLRPLLADLGRFLQVRQCGITELECRLRHRHAPETSCLLRLAAPVADVDRLTELLGERLSALALPEPVRACEIRSGLPVRRVLASNSLWQPGEYGGGSGPQSPELIERLRVRLGQESVYGLQLLQAHRPENAWSRCEPKVTNGTRAAGKHQPSGNSSVPSASQGASALPLTNARITPATPASLWPAFRRPLWLLPTPQQLEEVDGAPRRRGSLRFFGDVERIETGWWDGGDVGRDYYTAFDIHGVQLWIFRERAKPHRWFLHGMFG